MITTAIEHEGVEYCCLHNGDYSGDVIVKKDAAGTGNPEAKIPFAVMRQLVAEYVRDVKMRRLESASPAAVLDTWDEDQHHARK